MERRRHKKLLAAAASGRVELLERLVRGGVPPDAPLASAGSALGDSPLHAAARHAHAGAVIALLALGATAVDQRNAHGASATRPTLRFCSPLSVLMFVGVCVLSVSVPIGAWRCYRQYTARIGRQFATGDAHCAARCRAGASVVCFLAPWPSFSRFRCVLCRFMLFDFCLCMYCLKFIALRLWFVVSFFLFPSLGSLAYSHRSHRPIWCFSRSLFWRVFPNRRRAFYPFPFALFYGPIDLFVCGDAASCTGARQRCTRCAPRRTRSSSP